MPEPMNEEWRAVLGWEGLYEVSDIGSVRSLDRIIRKTSRRGNTYNHAIKGRILSPAQHAGGHLFVVLADGRRREQVFVHRLVLNAFQRPRENGEECRHLDGNHQNNCLLNLSWGTRLENIADRKRLGEENPARGERSGKSYLTESDVKRIRAENKNGKAMRQIARENGFGFQAVRSVCVGRTWAWLQ